MSSDSCRNLSVGLGLWNDYYCTESVAVMSSIPKRDTKYWQYPSMRKSWCHQDVPRVWQWCQASREKNEGFSVPINQERLISSKCTEVVTVTSSISKNWLKGFLKICRMRQGSSINFCIPERNGFYALVRDGNGLPVLLPSSFEVVMTRTLAQCHICQKVHHHHPIPRPDRRSKESWANGDAVGAKSTRTQYHCTHTYERMIKCELILKSIPKQSPSALTYLHTLQAKGHLQNRCDRL